MRWISGWVLLSFVTLHLANHALGLLSLQAADALRLLLHGFWRGPFGTLLLYGAAALHLGLALWSLLARRSLRMAPLDALRIALGLLLPLLLLTHVPSTRWAYEQFGLEAPYARVVRGLWTADGALLQLGLMTVAWSHACLGLHIAWRVRPLYRRSRPGLLLVAVLLPLLAALGFLMMGRELAWRELPEALRTTPAQAALVAEFKRLAWSLYGLALLTLVALRSLRALLERRRGATVALDYPQGRVLARAGWSVLETSLAHGIPHAAMCGGRSRCSTCRVRVEGPAAHANPIGADERRTLARVGAGPDVRLACQLRPRGALRITPLIDSRRPAERPEREVAVLFVDLRRWSGFSERHWPADLVYVLDRYFALVGEAVGEAGGLANQFVGDGVMAIFGLDCPLPEASRRALRAAGLIAARMEAWRAEIEQQFGHAIDYGMGLHCGAAAIGEVGHRDITSLTAIGEVVNTASRLQDQCKQAGTRLLVSEAVLQAAAEPLPAAGERLLLQLRGRSAPLAAYRRRP
ncbi:adenylate/guanylate cyclase domain-containing protein [Roseateles sp. DAIF2]|uniref:adenylate/guanylate cyclase domain-containing protein n=1 Tax=Roseateles sp. DAIF2 TaxID=2714952 RepID=UPI00201DAAD0|nr:adenylate/guanylate cyclase domain-containing protein [Roseateles sp. DAIF2]